MSSTSGGRVTFEFRNVAFWLKGSMNVCSVISYSVSLCVLMRAMFLLLIKFSLARQITQHEHCFIYRGFNGRIIHARH